MIIVITAIFSLLVIYLIEKFVKYKHNKWKNYVLYTENFYNISRSLLKNDNISDYVIDQIEFMSQTINKKKAARILLYVINKIKNENKLKNHVRNKNFIDKYVLDKNINEAEKLKILLHLQEANHNWMGAITSHSPFYGIMLKVAMEQYLSESDDMHKSIKRTYSKLSKINSHSGECHAV